VFEPGGLPLKKGTILLGMSSFYPRDDSRDSGVVHGAMCRLLFNK